MNPCNNCGADTRICIDCDIYNGYITTRKIEQLKDEIQFRIDNMGVGTKRSAYMDFLELIDEYCKET